MKTTTFRKSAVLFAIGASTLLAACGNAPEVIEIKPNETAFLIQMDGNSKNQRAFMSEDNREL